MQPWFVTRRHAVNGLDRIRKVVISATTDFPEFINSSRVASFIYYRGTAFIRSTFIYDLCVSEGHVVIRGLYEFLFSIPSKCINGIKILCRFIKGSGEVAVEIWRLFILPAVAGFLRIVVPFTSRQGLFVVCWGLSKLDAKVVVPFISDCLYIYRYDVIQPAPYRAVYRRVSGILSTCAATCLVAFMQGSSWVSKTSYRLAV